MQKARPAGRLGAAPEKRSSWVAGAIGRLTEIAVAGARTGELLVSAGYLTAGFVGLAALSLLERGLLDYVVVGRAVARAQPLVLEHALRCPLDYFEKRLPGDLRNVMVDLTTNAATATGGLVKPVFVGYAVFFYYFQRTVSAEGHRKIEAERALGGTGQHPETYPASIGQPQRVARTAASRNAFHPSVISVVLIRAPTATKPSCCVGERTIPPMPRCCTPMPHRWCLAAGAF